MRSIKIKKINKTIYEHTLDNGLTIFICKMPEFEKKLAFFQTKYGSLNNEFIPINKKDFKKFPLGIAHFLEHKLFESKDKNNIFEDFQKDTAYVNAATSYDATYYFFDCNENFNSNLKRLIDMVQSPYFTDENVEKEKGIIGQEIDMYQNDPDQTIYDKLYYNAFVNDPIKYDIAGTKKDIKCITKEDLYECYNTFYHPCNMFLTIVGNVDEKEVLKIIEENQKKKKFPKPLKIVNKEIIEPEEVAKTKEIIKRNVSARKIGYGYKIKLDKLSPVEDFKREFYIYTFLRTKFGPLTSFTEDLIKNKLVKSYFNYHPNISKKYLLITFSGDILDDKRVKKLIDDKLSDLNDLKESFELYKKESLANYVKMFENPATIASHIRYMYNKYEKLIDNCYEIYENISFNEYLEYIKTLNFSNQTKIIINENEGN